MIAPDLREDLDRRLAATAHLGTETRGLGAGPIFIKAADLLKADLPEHRWAVRGVLPEGLALLVGRPKIGKSWLALNLGIAIASGGAALGQIHVDPGDVLYLALEDHQRRLKDRLKSILNGETCPDRLTLSTSWPKLDERGLQWLEAWAEKHPAGRLIIIDTLERVRPAASKNGRLYGDDYAALSGLQGMAGRRGLTILVLHHTRKMASDDPLETISGTSGLGGAADSVLVLKRDRQHRDATLFITGRDVEETELTLRWDAMRTMWALLGDSLSEEREAVVRLLKHSGRPLAVKDIALALNRKPDTTRTLCWRMANSNQIRQVSNGVYGYVETPETVETVDTVDTEKRVSAYPAFQVYQG